MTLLKSFASNYDKQKTEEMTFEEYLQLCKTDPFTYANAAERMLKAIGEPEYVDTRHDPRLSRIHLNKKIRVYPAFSDFFGAEQAIEDVVSYFRHSEQGLEESKQILYLLGPVGGGKSSIAERIKQLMEKFPIYSLAVKVKDGRGERIVLSPIHESPLGLFNPNTDAQLAFSEYGIPKQYLKGIPSAWAQKRLDEFGGDITKFTVVRLYPSIVKNLAITKVEPGDENNQDTSTLVGKVNIRQLEFFNQDDVDAYSFSGGLCLGNQGIMEFVEMFKAPIKMLNPLLTATQEKNYKGTESGPTIPFDGIIIAHSNETEWASFKNDNKNEAFLDRVFTVKVPYCLRYTEEEMIYRKMLAASKLGAAPCAPWTLKMLSMFSVLTRLIAPENNNLKSKMQIYNGDDIKSQDPRAKNIMEYRDAAGPDEGMAGTSTRYAFKILSKVFNQDVGEVASADPVHLMLVLEKQIVADQHPKDIETLYLNLVKDVLAKEYMVALEEDIKEAYLEDSDGYGQSVFDTYIQYADAWIQEKDYVDEHSTMDSEKLNAELEKTEKPAGISNPKDFRHDIVNWYYRTRSANDGPPRWNSYEKIRRVIEKKIFSTMDEILPILTFEAKRDSEMEKKHQNFLMRMEKKGYTRSQIKRVVSWFIRSRKS